LSELLIKNGYVVTVDPGFTLLPGGAVYVRDSYIADIGPTEDLETRYPGARVIDAQGKAVLPGLINTHMHSGLIRGTAEDLPVFEWLRKHVDPKHRVLTAEDAYVAASMCYAESLLAGTTCVLDMYRFMDRCADAAEVIGIRAVLAPYVADKPQYDYYESIAGNIALVESRHGSAHGRIHAWFGLEHLAYCSEQAYLQVAHLASQYGVGIHTHGEESLEMAVRITKAHRRTPIQLFHDRGILGPRTVLAHCVWVTPTEIQLLAKTGTAVAHCPVSNMKLASGVAPIPDYLAQGVKVGLGTDGIKENNNLDMFEEMKAASLLQKVHLLEATTLPAGETLRLATIGGARALGLDREIGSLEVGKKADLITVDLHKLHMTPVLDDGEFANVVANLVYSAHGLDVNTVIVNGEVLVQERRILTADVDELIDRANAATRALIERRRPYVPRDSDAPDLQV
jgi:5-methylthioadenosine/S-adenosylhomocysteine deaminase